MNPYKIDIDKLKESATITDEKELLKLKLLSSILKIQSKMPTVDILEKTGLDKSDLSRIRSLNIERFTIDRLIGILNSLGHSVKISVTPSGKFS